MSHSGVAALIAGFATGATVLFLLLGAEPFAIAALAGSAVFTGLWAIIASIDGALERAFERFGKHGKGMGAAGAGG